MAINLVDAIMDQLKGPIIEQLGGLIGESPEKTQKAAEGIVPALLSGLVGTAAKSDGGGLITSILDKVDDSVLDGVSTVLGGSEASSVSSTGSSLLTSLFGDNMVSSLVSGIATFAGLGAESSKSLLGFVAPIALGAFKRAVKSEGLDASGLVGMLLGQKDTIARALPSGLSDLLQASGLLSGVAGKAQEAISTVQQAAQGDIEEHKSPLRWLLPTLLLVALGFLLTKWFAEEKPRDTARPATGSAYQTPAPSAP